MKLVYICSRYRADATHTIEEAVDSALYACSVAISKGYAPTLTPVRNSTRPT